MFFITVLLTTGCKANDRPSVSSIIENFNSIIVDDQNARGLHISTRPHNRKLIYHAPSGYWYVFYGHGDKDPDGKYRISWRSSKDGVHWSERQTAFEGSSHGSSLDVLLTEDKITALVFRREYYREKANIPTSVTGEKHWYDRSEYNFSLPLEIRQYDIRGGSLVPGTIYKVMDGTASKHAHYGSLTRDTDGFFWAGARAGGDWDPREAWVVRSSSANDISRWEPYVVLFRAASPGTVTVQVVALDSGKVFAVIFSQPDRRVLGSLYDPATGKWGSPYIIAEGNSGSKRVVALFDPGTKRLHLVNVDDSGALRHKILSAPYREQDWLPKAGTNIPGILIDSDVIAKPKADDNISLSIDTSKVPAPLVVAYHKNTANYRLRWYTSTGWEKEDFPIGIQDPDRRVDEISFIRDFSEKLGLIYYVLPDKKTDKGELHFMEIPKK